MAEPYVERGMGRGVVHLDKAMDCASMGQAYVQQGCLSIPLKPL